PGRDQAVDGRQHRVPGRPADQRRADRRRDRRPRRGPDRREGGAQGTARLQPRIPVDLRIPAWPGACLMPDETLSPVPEQKPNQKPLRRLFGYLLQARRRLVTTVILSFFGTLLALIPAVQVGRIINGPIASGDKTQLGWDLLLLLVFAAGGFLGMWIGGRVL